MHIHALVLDGVFARAEDGRLVFDSTDSLTDADVADVLAAIGPGVTRLLARRGFGASDDGTRSDDFAEATPRLAGLAAASVQGLVALGRAPGQRPRRFGDVPEDISDRYGGGTKPTKPRAFAGYANFNRPAARSRMRKCPGVRIGIP